MSNRRGDAIVLWNSLASLPVASSLVDATSGVASTPKKNGIEINARGGVIEIWRDDVLDTHLTPATGVLTLAGNAVANETVTIDAVVYTWKASVGATANEVKVGADASTSIDNLIAAITGAAGSGTLYGSATVAHPTVTAAAGAGDTMNLTARTGGTDGNAIATTETMTQGSFGAATLTGGASEVDTFTTVDAPVTFYGWNGSAWVAEEVIAVADFTVGRQRGVEYEVANAGAYDRLALVATGASLTDSATVRALYIPILDLPIV